jgi:hypothetical protein
MTSQETIRLLGQTSPLGSSGDFLTTVPYQELPHEVAKLLESNKFLTHFRVPLFMCHNFPNGALKVNVNVVLVRLAIVFVSEATHWLIAGRANHEPVIRICAGVRTTLPACDHLRVFGCPGSRNCWLTTGLICISPHKAPMLDFVSGQGAEPARPRGDQAGCGVGLETNWGTTIVRGEHTSRREVVIVVSSAPAPDVELHHTEGSVPVLGGLAQDGICGRR